MVQVMKIVLMDIYAILTGLNLFITFSESKFISFQGYIDYEFGSDLR